jgi:hypothetical protein
MELSMSLLPPNPDFRFEMEDDDLVAPHIAEGLSDNLCPFDMGLPHHDLVIAGYEKNLIQLDLASWLDCQALYFDDLSRGNSVLLSSGFNYCVNCFPPVRDAD